jgi:hypothetical protein
VRRPFSSAAVVSAGALLLLELCLRLLTRSGSFLGFPLLPLDVTAPVRSGRPDDPGRSYLVFDPDLGWTVGASRQGAGGLYRSSSFGARWDLRPEPPPGRPFWALCFGDSFTHGDDVAWEETWPRGLSTVLGKTVLNFGVPGYGVDQAWLRYRKVGRGWPSERVFIGFMADNIGRHLNRYRPFISPEEKLYLAKPRFLLRGADLQLLPQPFVHEEDYSAPDLEARLLALGGDDAWYRPEWYRPKTWDVWRTARVLRTAGALRESRSAAWRRLYDDEQAVELTARLITGFAREVREDGREPVLVFFPDKTLCRDALAGRRSLAAPILSRLSASGLTVLDLTAPLVSFLAGESSLDHHFRPHYSAELHQRAAVWLAAALAPRSVPQARESSRR